MFGMGRVTVDPETLKIGKIEVFFDPDTFMKTLEGEKDSSETARGQTLLGDVSSTAIEKIEAQKSASADTDAGDGESKVCVIN